MSIREAINAARYGTAHAADRRADLASAGLQSSAERLHETSQDRNGKTLAFFQSVIRRTADALRHLHDQSHHLAEQKDLERFLAANPYIMNDIGLSPENKTSVPLFGESAARLRQMTQQCETGDADF